MSTQIIRVGIVDGVKARRKSGEVLSLAITVRFETELQSIYNYGDDKVEIDDVQFSVPATSGINPGDLVTLDVRFQSPEGQRFQPALEASTTSTADADTA